MFEEMSESAFPSFLAAFWEEKGWDATVKPNDDGTYLVAGDRDDGRRGLIGVRPDADTEIDGDEVRGFARFCDRKGVDVRVMATRGRFTTAARDAADDVDVHLLDPNELASAVREENAEHLVDEHTGDGGDGASLLGSVTALLPGGVPSGVPVVPILVAAAVVLAAVFAGGTLVSVVPFVGGGGGGDTDPAFTALSLAGGENATVAWDARVQDEIRATNETYTARENQTFVVVQFDVAAGDAPATLRAEHFALAVNGTNHAVQPFANTSTEFRSKLLPKRVAANSSKRAVLVFSVPEGFDGATLLETYGGPGVRFERADLAFDVE